MSANQPTSAKLTQAQLLAKAARMTADRNYINHLADKYARLIVAVQLLVIAMEENEKHDQKAKELFNRARLEAMAKQEKCEQWLSDNQQLYDDMMREVNEGNETT